jgi:hypothetical protein
MPRLLGVTLLMTVKLERVQRNSQLYAAVVFVTHVPYNYACALESQTFHTFTRYKVFLVLFFLFLFFEDR